MNVEHSNLPEEISYQDKGISFGQFVANDLEHVFGTCCRDMFRNHVSGTYSRNVFQKHVSGAYFKNMLQKHVSGTSFVNIVQQYGIY